jgi:broad specificity phosphatase PhoE
VNYKKKKIFLIRHGETDNNKNNILQGGNVDISLNEAGLLQSSQFFNKYKSTPFKKIYTSTLIRSIESVESFINLGIPHEAHPNLNEISFGIYDGNTSCFDKDSPYHKLVKDWDSGKVESKLEGGENPIEVKARLTNFINIILQNDEDLILICMHGRAMRIFLASILNYNLRYMNIFPHKNLSLYTLNYTGSMFFIEKFNDTSHLKNISSITHRI